jgi:hypothetical protein
MSTYPYQAFYCEENIWKTCRLDPFEVDRVDVVIISNDMDAAPLWNQRAAPSPLQPVFWDYHVVVIEHLEVPVVWDLDTRLETPSPFDRWWEGTFAALDRLPERLEPVFRLLTRQEYFEVFSSDRSHMRSEEGGYKKPPPPWEPIYDPATGHTLDRLVDLGDPFAGELVDVDEMLERFSQ